MSLRTWLRSLPYYHLQSCLFTTDLNPTSPPPSSFFFLLFPLPFYPLPTSPLLSIACSTPVCPTSPPPYVPCIPYYLLFTPSSRFLYTLTSIFLLSLPISVLFFCLLAYPLTSPPSHPSQPCSRLAAYPRQPLLHRDHASPTSLIALYGTQCFPCISATVATRRSFTYNPSNLQLPISLPSARTNGCSRTVRPVTYSLNLRMCTLTATLVPAARSSLSDSCRANGCLHETTTPPIP